MRRSLVLAVPLMLVAPAPGACPSPGDTLLSLVESAEVIALVQPAAASFDGEAAAVDVRVEVRELWKGSAPDELELDWLPQCAGSGAQLVFLVEAGGKFLPLLPLALAPCASTDDLEVLRSRVDEAQRVLASGDAEQRRRFAVENLALRATRADASYELAFADQDGRPPRLPSLAEQVLVARGFKDEPVADEGLPAVLRFLDRYDDPLFEEAVLRALAPALEADEPDDWLAESLQLVLERHAPAATLEAFAPARALDQSSGSALRQAWSRAKQYYRLPG